MTIRLEMLRAAARAKPLLNDSGQSVIRFIQSRYHRSGGYRGRGDELDLYYTVFAAAALDTLRYRRPLNRTRRYVDSFGTGARLDFVHLACLARLRAALFPRDRRMVDTILGGLERFRAADGGYCGGAPGAAQGTAHAAFLATLAYADLERPLPDVDRLLQAVEELHHLDAQSMCLAFQQKLDQFTEGLPQHDDITVAVLRVGAESGREE